MKDSKPKFQIDPTLELTIPTDEFNLIHHMRQPTLTDLCEIERICKTSITFLKGKTLVFNSSELDPDIELYNLCCQGVDGYGDLGDNWIDKVPAVHKTIISQLLSAGEIFEKEEVSEKFGPKYLKKPEYDKKVIYLKTWQAGNDILTIHTFSLPHDTDLAKFKRIQSLSNTRYDKKNIIITSGSTVQSYTELYDKLIIAADGYDTTKKLPAAVPAKHKIQTVLELFNFFQQMVDKILGN
jgi:hypothetical protein